jgi:hypothetical protein
MYLSVCLTRLYLRITDLKKSSARMRHYRALFSTFACKAFILTSTFAQLSSMAAMLDPKLAST